MNQQERSAGIAEMTIHRLIESLFHLFTLGKATSEELNKLTEKLRLLDTGNSDYAGINGDKRENIKIWWRMLIIVLSIGVDFLLTYQAIAILNTWFNFPRILQFLVPVFLIVVELGISYFQILNQRNGEHSSWFVRKAPYLVIIILLGLTILVIVYSVQSYNVSTDKMSFGAFVISTLLFQIILFIASLLLHIWLIKNSEDIVEAFAHLHYKIVRYGIINKISQLDTQIKKNHMQRFSVDTHTLIQKIEFFRRDYPNRSVDFSKTMPADLISAVNLVMGKRVFAVVNDHLVH